MERIARIFKVRASKASELTSINLKSSLSINPLQNLSYEQLVNEIKGLTEIESIPWYPSAFKIIGNKQDLTQNKIFTDGNIYIRNASSLLPVIALDPKGGEDILDMCAAPGGKSIHIQSVCNNKANLWLNDISHSRTQNMLEILENYNVKHEPATILPGEILHERIDKKFDKILLDAQCSGEGMLDLSHPQALRFWSTEKIKKFSSLQKRLGASAYEMLKPGGVLVYSTCTYAPEENESIINYLLGKFPDLTIEDIDIEIPGRMNGLTEWGNRKFRPEVKRAVRVIPSEYMEGFFVCKLRKAD
ncbi:RsmB/NOP family class I SAM-dependent RNA methyltransferase [candidate division KSB1 bacterium]